MGKDTAYRLEISPKGLTVPIRSDQTILEAALSAGFDFPHNCLVGSCTQCKCRLVDGPVKQLSDTSYVLEAEELERGYILACQTLAKGNLSIVLGPDAG